jgi:hypothetical protein
MDRLDSHHPITQLPQRTSHSSWLELAKLEYSPLKDRVSGLLQHVCSSFRNHLIEHLPCQ